MRRKNAHTVDAHTIDGQQNIPFFVILLYNAKYKCTYCQMTLSCVNR